MKHRLRSYVQSRLHRRLFVWFGWTIFVTGTATFASMHTLNRFTTEPLTHQVLPRSMKFLSQRAAHEWGNLAQEQQLLDELGDALPLGAFIEDSAGKRLASTGACSNATARAPIVVAGSTVGILGICPVGFDPAQGVGRAFLAIFVVCGVLWAMTGGLARRLSRPLMDLTRVAQDIGAGRLDRRARLSMRQPGEVGALAYAINDMAGKIEKQLADARTMLAMVSHELRTPLARLRVLVELGRNDAGRAAKAFDEIEQEVQEIDVLVGELLASSRIDFGALSLRTMAPADLAARALERAALPAQRAVIETEVTQCSADPTLMARALSNLLENAKKHGNDVTRLRVYSSSTHLHFDVEDAGPGISPEHPEQIFEMFYQGPHARERDPKSLGLGLALVRRIAEAHGGRAYASNKPEGGACIGFTIQKGTS